MEKITEITIIKQQNFCPLEKSMKTKRKIENKNEKSRRIMK